MSDEVPQATGPAATALQEQSCDPEAGIISRRQFLRLTGASLAAITMPAALRLPGRPSTYVVERADYPRQMIGSLRELSPGRSAPFNYPWDDSASASFLVLLDEEAALGVGPDKNVVAFNSFCTHQGGPLAGTVHGEIGVVGPCPLHLTTFDLSRLGMVVSGHATLGLPQIVLETEADEIYAVGMQGLIYGHHDNRAGSES